MSRKKRAQLGMLFLFSLIGLGLAALSLTYKSARSLARSEYRPGSPSRSFADWDEVFEGAVRVQHHALDTGAVHVSRVKNLSQAHPLSSSYEDSAPLRVFAHLIQHPEKGDFLVDSGLDASFASDPYGNIASPARYVLAALMDAPYSQKPGTDIFAALRKHAAKPQAIFFTHLHMDHTAGIPALSSSVRLVTGPGEADDWVGWFGFGHVTSERRWEELDFTQARLLPVLGPCINVLGDGSLWAISTPGHSDGHVSFLVMDQEGPLLLTGDASHFNWAFEHDVGPDGSDPSLAQQSLERLRAFVAAYPQVRVHTGHEALQ